MDPSHDGRRVLKESCSEESSSRRHGDGPPPMMAAPPPMMAPPNMMYYQPGMGYHPGYAPHQGYPPYQNEYPQQPNTYHYPAGPYFSTPPTYHNDRRSKAFVRGFIMCSCLIFTCLLLTILIIALVLHPQLPIYTVNSLSVTGFNTTTASTADWNTSIMVKNINARLNGVFSNFRVDLLRNEGILAFSYVPDFELNKNMVKQIDMTLLSNGFLFPKSGVDDMAKEQAGGSIVFSLRITSMVAFKSSTMSTRNTMLLALCEELNVVFENNTGKGVLDNARSPISCQLYM